jgi:hypothetical protein
MTTRQEAEARVRVARAAWREVYDGEHVTEAEEAAAWLEMYRAEEALADLAEVKL